MKRIPFVLAGAAVVLALSLATVGSGPKPPGDHRPARGSAYRVTLASKHRLPATDVPVASIPSSAALKSKTFAGYAVRQPGRSFQSVQASFFVPFLNCAVSSDASSSAWVGFDDIVNAAREAVGVEADCSAGVPAYFSWYQAAASAASPVQRGFKVNAGDFITANVTFSTNHRFVMTLTDSTLGKSATKYGTCPQSACRRISAEVISEATPVSGVPAPLADYGAESFTGISVTDTRGHHGGFYARWWKTVEITQIGMTSAKVIAQPTGLHLGKSFDNYWLGLN